jgi:hypothetical protein
MRDILLQPGIRGIVQLDIGVGGDGVMGWREGGRVEIGLWLRVGEIFEENDLGRKLRLISPTNVDDDGSRHTGFISAGTTSSSAVSETSASMLCGVWKD